MCVCAGSVCSGLNVCVTVFVCVPRVPLEEDASQSRAIYVFIGAGAVGSSQWFKQWKKV